MRREAIIAGVILTLFRFNAAVAQSGVDPAITAANRGLSFYIGGTRQHYYEFGSSGTIDREDGTLLPRLGLQYSVLGVETPLRVALDFNVTHDNTYYSGALQDGTPFSAITANEFTRLNLDIGYVLQLGSLALIPGIEYGHTRWRRDGAPGDTLHGVTETYYHDHMALTLTGQYALTDKTVVGLGAAYGTTSRPRMTIDALGGVSVSSPNFVLGSKPWTCLRLRLDYAAERRFHIGARVSYVRYAYGASALYSVGGSQWYEPDSQTSQTSIDLLFTYSFQ